MRKLLIMLAIAVIAMPSTGCGGRIRNWWHRGAPCGTVVAPATLGAPLAIGRPVRPMMVSQPECCCPPECCEPCCDPCECPGSEWTTSYSDSGCTDCASAPVTTYSDDYTLPTTPSSTLTPQDPGTSYRSPADSN